MREMITAIKGGAHKNKKKELKSIRVIGILYLYSHARNARNARTHARNATHATFFDQALGVTCVASSFSVMEGNCFPIVFLDECSQMLEPLSLLPIGRFGCSRLVFTPLPLPLSPSPSLPFSPSPPLPLSPSHSLSSFSSSS